METKEERILSYQRKKKGKKKRSNITIKKNSNKPYNRSKEKSNG